MEIKKTIEPQNTHELKVVIEDDDYGVLCRYKDWAEIPMNEAVQGIFSYSMRIIRNIIKYHHNYDNVADLIEHIAKENNFDYQAIRESDLYNSFEKQCVEYTKKRCEYTLYERSDWYDILALMFSMFAKYHKSNKVSN